MSDTSEALLAVVVAFILWLLMVIGCALIGGLFDTGITHLFQGMIPDLPLLSFKQALALNGLAAALISPIWVIGMMLKGE